MNTNEIKQLRKNSVYPIVKDVIKAKLIKEQKEQNKFRLLHSNSK